MPNLIERTKSAGRESVEKAKEIGESVKEKTGEAVESGKDKIETAKKAKKAWTELMHKVEVMKSVKDEMEYLYKDFAKLDFMQIMERLKGIAVVGMLGMLMYKDEFNEWKKEHSDIRLSNATTGAKLDHEGYEVDEVTTKKQRFVNTHAILFYDEKGNKRKKDGKGSMNDIAKKLDDLNVKPSQDIKNGSGKFLENGLGNYDNFKEHAVDYLVDKSVKDPKERMRQAVLILSHSATGRFQIIPAYHFGKMGWPVKGEACLKAIYEFIQSSDRQYALFRKILSNSWGRHKKAEYVAVEYYHGSAKKYKKNPKAERFTRRSGPLNSKGIPAYESIREYALEAQQYFDEFKAKHPQLSEVDCLAMSIEKKESYGTYARERILGGEKPKQNKEKIKAKSPQEYYYYGEPVIPKSYKDNRKDVARGGAEGEGTRILKYEVNKEKAFEYISQMKSDESIVWVPTPPGWPKKRAKLTVAKAIKYANELAAKDGYVILVGDGYRNPKIQAEKAEARRKKDKALGINTGHSKVGRPGGSWHQGAAAVDISLYRIGHTDHAKRLTENGRPNDKIYQEIMEHYMNAAGFVRLDGEHWHFEIGSGSWSNIMNKANMWPGKKWPEKGVYKRDQLGQKSHHDHDKSHEAQKYADIGSMPTNKEELEAIKKIRKNEKIIPPSSSEIINDKGDGMSTFVKMEKLNEKGAKAKVEKLPGNGNREVLMYVPPNVDLKAGNLKIIYSFHGTFAEKINHYPESKKGGVKKREWLGWKRMEENIAAINELASMGENVILVYPKSKGPRWFKHNDKKFYNYDRAWMTKGKSYISAEKNTSGKYQEIRGEDSNENFDEMHNQVLKKLGIQQNQVSRIEAQGHSAGGVPLRNIAQSGSKLVDEYRFLDASYGDWAEDCYNAAREHGDAKVTLIIAKYGSEGSSSPKQEAQKKYGVNWEEANSPVYKRHKVKANMEVITSNVSHGDMPRKFTGELEAKKAA